MRINMMANFVIISSGPKRGNAMDGFNTDHT